MEEVEDLDRQPRAAAAQALSSMGGEGDGRGDPAPEGGADLEEAKREGITVQDLGIYAMQLALDQYEVDAVIEAPPKRRNRG